MFQFRTERRCALSAALAFTAIVCPAFTALAQNTSQLSGFVYIDRNNDGMLVFSNQPNPEWVIPGVSIELYSMNGTTETLLSSTLTDSIGKYVFEDLAPGTYSVREVQPVEYYDGIDTLGEIRGLVGALPPGSYDVGQVADNAFTGIVLPAEAEGYLYNFGERGLLPQYVSKRYLLGSAPPPQYASIPEPASALLAALAGLALAWRKCRK